jgi:diaminopropionate ammonia-lyase
MSGRVSKEGAGAAVAVRQPHPVETLALGPTLNPRDYHASISGYQPTPLRNARRAADRLHVARVSVKDESQRLGLPSFKVLGASWAIYRALVAQLGVAPSSALTFDELRRAVEPLRPFTLSAATDGNHGRAVAHVAAMLGFDANIYVPEDMIEARRNAIAAEGATVTVVAGGYDDAVRRSARDAGERCLVISDTSWQGYEQMDTQLYLPRSTSSFSKPACRVPMLSSCRWASERSRPRPYVISGLLRLHGRC